MSPARRAGRMTVVISERPRTALTSAWWAPGQTSAERRGPAAAQGIPPGWAEFTEAALAGAVPAEPPSGWREALASVFRPLVTCVRERVGQAAGGLPGIQLTPVTDGIAEQLGYRLAALGVRALVLELNRAREAGTLSGGTTEERFTDFVRQTGTSDGLARLFTKYPVLARLTGQACLYTIETSVELLQRLTEDRGAIEARFGEFGVLTRAGGGAGDAHARGRSVRLLEFSCGRKLVYKPRPLDLHARFTEIVGWLNARVPSLELSTVDALVRPGYGWLEFVERAPCADLGDVDRFYRRQGVLLALLHALDGTDVHYENLIARGDHPVLVDLETLFHPSLRGTAGDDPAAEVLAASVQRTLLLPRLLVGEQAALDISGLGGRGGRLPDDRVDWAAPGTDRMRLVRVPGELEGALNLPSLDGREIDPAEHTAALLGGFRTGYDAIAAGRDELARVLRRASRDAIRVVIRPTSFYSRLLDETTHPELLRDATAREKAFDLLETDSAGDPARQRLVAAEKADLWHGDIPLFIARPGTTAVWDTRGHRHDEVLARPSQEAVLGKIAAMTSVDQRDQEWLITAALATAVADGGHHSAGTDADAQPSQEPDTAQLLVAACGIADHLLARAFTAGERTNWLGLERVDERYWTVLPMGAGLGEGYTGVALFLAELARLTGIARYHDLAVRAVRPLPALLAKLRDDPELAEAAGCGGPLGLGGVAYAVSRLSTLLDDGVPDGLVEQAVAVMPNGGPGTAPQFTVGLAGGLTAMRAVHTGTGLDAAAKLADRYAGLLLTQPSPTDPGFARGADGVTWALASAGFGTAGRAPYGEDPAALSGDDHGWCGGLAGALLARAEVRTSGNAVEKAIAALADRAPLKDLSLCHGEAGIAETLCLLAETGHTGAASALRHRTGRLLAALDRHGARCGTPGAVPAPGLLTGLAGIGHALLRLGFTERVPSALLLQAH